MSTESLIIIKPHHELPRGLPPEQHKTTNPTPELQLACTKPAGSIAIAATTEQPDFTTTETPVKQITQDPTTKTSEDADTPIPPPTPDHPAYDSWQLALRLKKNDPEAMGELYEKYMTNMQNFIYSLVHDPELAQDLTSEAFLRAVQKIHTYEWQEKDIEAWLFTICRNLTYDHFKSGRHRLNILVEDVVNDTPNGLGYSRTDLPEQSTLDHFRNLDLMRAIKQLSKTQRECILCRFVEELSVEETARRLGKSVGATKAIQTRAMNNLRNWLPPDLHLNF